jgi:phosphonoacetaldehyde hydrolase
MKLRAVILDWAGTAVDHGSRAPVAAMQSIFEEAGIPISIGEARESMGLAKKSHIRSILEIPRVRSAWAESKPAESFEHGVEKLYARFIPKQLECLSSYSTLIDGVAEAVARMRARGLKIGSTTGYTRPMLDFLLARAVEQGYVPDSSICPDEAGGGRPMPWMCYLTAMRLQEFPMAAFVKIGDSPTDIEEGLNAGMWTIGVTRTGNEVGLTEAEWEALSESERDTALCVAKKRLVDAGAHYTAESVAECDALLDEIEFRLGRREKP